MGRHRLGLSMQTRAKEGGGLNEPIYPFARYRLHNWWLRNESCHFGRWTRVGKAEKEDRNNTVNDTKQMWATRSSACSSRKTLTLPTYTLSEGEGVRRQKRRCECFHRSRRGNERERKPRKEGAREELRTFPPISKGEQERAK